MSKLSEESISEKLAQYPSWSLGNGSLTIDVKFKDFVAAFGFIAQVALLAEKQNHHPDWSNSYNYVKIQLKSHDVDAITERDFKLLAAIDRLLPHS
jgi:4a-hydroxytetrahydrobiopterin dehydratase